MAGTGIGILPEFILREALAAGRLERLLPDWSLPVCAENLVRLIW
jgi:DNA-binding transcriptional LysR family regulator